jgi:hypothetical protein
MNERATALSLQDFYFRTLPIARVSNPYLSCKAASENLGFSHQTAKSWGATQAGVTVPLQSYEDSIWWGYWLSAMTMMDINVMRTEMIDKGFPDMDNTLLEKSEIMHEIFNRMTQLYVSPTSATFRMPNAGANKVRNCVDHIVLNHIRTLKIDHYKYLDLKPEFFSIGHARQAVPRMKKGEVGPVKHELFWIVQSQLDIDDDCETLFGVIVAILKRIGDIALEKSDYSIPQNVFKAPGRKLLDGIRKGPRRTTGKNKLKPVLYFPFSFVKSKKFENIEPSFRKHMSEAAQQVAEITSLINPMSVQLANKKLEIFRHSIKSLYELSDDMRETIEKTNSSLSPSLVKEAIIEIKGGLVDPRVLDTSLIEQILRRLKSTDRILVPLIREPPGVNPG